MSDKKVEEQKIILQFQKASQLGFQILTTEEARLNRDSDHLFI